MSLNTKIQALDCVIVSECGAVDNLKLGDIIHEGPPDGESFLIPEGALDRISISNLNGGRDDEMGTGKASKVIHAQWLNKFPDVLVAFVEEEHYRLV